MESVVQGVNFVIKRRANVSSGQRQSSSCSREGTLDNKTPWCSSRGWILHNERFWPGSTCYIGNGLFLKVRNGDRFSACSVYLTHRWRWGGYPSRVSGRIPSRHSVHFYLALSLPSRNKEDLLAIHSLTAQADTSIEGQIQLEGLMLGWPTVFTHDMGHTALVKHWILTTNEVPVRKRAYRVSNEKQAFIDEQLKEMLYKDIIIHLPHPGLHR